MAYHDDPYQSQDIGSADPLRMSAPEQRPPISPLGFPSTSATSPYLGADDTQSSPGASDVTAMAMSPVERGSEPTASGNRDRLLVHWLWELLLAAVVAGLGYLLWQAAPEALDSEALPRLLVFATGFGLLGIAAGGSLRAGVPNLAIGPMAAAAGLYFAQRGDEGVVMPTLFALGLAVVVGVLTWLVIAIFNVPGWIVTLGVAAVVVVWLQLQPASVPLAGEFDPTGRATLLFPAVAAVSVLAGLIGMNKSVRSIFERCRPTPTGRPPGGAVVFTGLLLVSSMVLSVFAGVVLVAGAGTPAQGSVGVNWLLWTMLGLGVALVGGTSAYGRRGGVFGTMLAVVALVLFHRYQQEQGWAIALLATAVGMVGIGLVVTRLVERFGRKVSPEDNQDGHTESGAAATAPDPDPWATHSGRTDRVADTTFADSTDVWSSALPARPASSAPASPWDDEHWGRS